MRWAGEARVVSLACTGLIGKRLSFSTERQARPITSTTTCECTVAP